MNTPTFEPGKTYRTANGRTMRIEPARDNSITGAEVGRSGHNTYRLMYDLNGIARGGPGWAGFQLLPGAIEDEPKPGYNRDVQSGFQTCDDARAIPHRRLDEHRTAEGIASGQDDGRTAIHPLEADELARRDDHAKRLAILESKFASLVRIHDAHAGHIIEASMRLAAIEKVLPLHTNRMGNLQDRITEAERDITTVGDRVTALESRSAWSLLGRLLTEFHGKDVANRLDALETRMNADVGAIWCRSPITGDAVNVTPKRTIKGGWVNVYRYERSPVLHVSPVIFAKKDDCESEGTANRIACIQIPDITEGEGL